jgi:hypothetical protein
MFGPRRVTKPKLSLTIQLNAPDCMWIPASEERMRDTGSDIGHYIVRPQVFNYGNEDARDIEVQMIRLWIIGEDGERLLDPLFLPLLLRWSWWPDDSAPAAWLPRLLPGTSKHYDLLVVASEQDPRPGTKRRNHGEMTGPQKSWIAFQTAYGPLDDDSIQNRMHKAPGHYQLDLAVAASNAKTIYRTAHISFDGWRDNAAEMFGKSGGLNIGITETPSQRAAHSLTQRLAPEMQAARPTTDAQD